MPRLRSRQSHPRRHTLAAYLWPPAGPSIRSCRDADRGRARQMADGPVEQGHHVLMRRARVVIQRHKALSGRYQPAPCHEWRVWRYLLGDQPSKPLFRPVWQMEAAAPTCQRQRSYKAVAVPVLEAALHPRLAVGNTTSSICQQLDVAKRCLIRGVKWHVSPRRSHCLNDTTRLAKRNKITSQRRGRWRTVGACRALPTYLGGLA